MINLSREGMLEKLVLCRHPTASSQSRVLKSFSPSSPLT